MGGCNGRCKRMRFENPILLIFLLLVPFLVAKYLMNVKEQKGGSIQYSDLRYLKSLKPSRLFKYRHIIEILSILTIILLVIALARPQVETKKKEEKILVEGINIVIALDVSGSMSDITAQGKTKLDMSREAVTGFIQGRKYDRIGMVIFAGMSVVLCPPTHDYDLLLKFWDKSRLESLTDGTAIGKAIATALNQLVEEGEGLRPEPAKRKNKIIILVTDGINNIKEIMPLDAANIARVIGIKIYTIGVGKDADENTLKKMASLTEGKYFFITDKEGLSNAYHEIGELEKEKYEIKEYVSYYDLLQYFLIPAFVFFIVEVILSNTRFRKIP